MKIKDIKHHITNPNPLMIDIGAYDGRDSLDFLNEFPGGRAIAIEPLSYKLIPDHPRLDVLPVAITKYPCITEMFVCQSHPQSSSMHQPNQHLNFWPEYQFKEMKPVIGMDGDQLARYYFAAVSPTIDLIWIDVNGFEMDIIKSIWKSFYQTKFIKIEVSNKELYFGQSNAEDVIRELQSICEWEILRIERCEPDGAFMNVFLRNKGIA